MSTLVFLTSLFCHFRLFCKLAAAESYFSSFIWLGWLRTQWDNTRKRGKATKDIIWSLLRRHQKICCRLRRKTDRHRSIRRRSLLLLFREREKQTRERSRKIWKVKEGRKNTWICARTETSAFTSYIPLFCTIHSFSFQSFLPMFFKPFFSLLVSEWQHVYMCVYAVCSHLFPSVFVLLFSSSSLSAVAPKLYFPN